MKLFELAATKPSKQAAKVFESYFGDSINVDVISPKQARAMLSKVRNLVNEHRATPAFHKSEQNPTYLKLMMMERVLSAKVKEDGGATVGLVGQTPQGTPTNTQAPGGTAPTAANNQMAMAKLNKIKDTATKTAATAALNTVGQGKPVTDPKQQQALAQLATVTESRQVRRYIYNILRESEIQQAQVVLAAQDMVDQVQKMLEQVTSMQFKDLPALVDQIKNQVGVDQAMQFNTDATAALAGLVQNLQQSKTQMDAALGTVTGTGAPAVPGMDDAGMGGELPDEGGLGDELGGEPDLGAEPDLGGLDDEEPEAPEGGGAGLGRAKR